MVNFPSSHFWPQCRNRLSLSGTVNGSLFCFLHFCWSQITAWTRRTRFLSATVFQRKKNFVSELFLLAGVGTGQSTETCTYLRRPIQRLRDWSGRIPVTVLVVTHQTKDPCKRENALSCANNNVVNCPCAVKTCSVSSKMLTGSSKDPNLDFLRMACQRCKFFDHFPFFSARETAFFVTAARNWVDLASLFVN